MIAKTCQHCLLATFQDQKSPNILDFPRLKMHFIVNFPAFSANVPASNIEIYRFSGSVCTGVQNVGTTTSHTLRLRGMSPRYAACGATMTRRQQSDIFQAATSRCDARNYSVGTGDGRHGCRRCRRDQSVAIGTSSTVTCTDGSLQ